MFIVVAVAVGALTVVLAIALFGGKGKHLPRVGSSLLARDLASRVTLTPSDWGPGFAEDNPYEDMDMNEGVADHNCKYVREPTVGALAVLARNVKSTDEVVYDSSTFTVYQGAIFAQSDMVRTREDAQRCKTERDAETKVRWEDVHTVDMPTPKGFDDVVAEEGRQVTDEKGRKVDVYYTFLVGRKDAFVMQSYVSRYGTQVGNRSDAVNALSLMLSRLYSAPAEG
ncbi:hypothetical protein ACFXKC_12760 [Streptomyces sp. NPDC059340]|uniref:hypothetical protein n=1 Tax=Streptomyces sp. NPDC059340 TaxID=3346806 RepID=UPI0036BEBECC